MTTRSTLGLLAAATMVAALAAPALAADEPDPDAPIAVDLIAGLDWSLVRQQVDGVLTELPADVIVTLRLEDGTATGNGGCNDYFGSYQLDGDALTFGAIGATEMYCFGSSDVEAAYFANLAAVATGVSTGGTLVMTDAAGGIILEFEPSATDVIPADGLEGLAWQLDSLLLPGTDELTPVPACVVATIELENGESSGSGGCNGYSASYELNGSDLVFGPVLSTRMACPEPAMGLENALFAQLGAVAGWYSDGGSVTFVDATGVPLAHFVPTAAG
jgi:heat shock protein HslJ